MSDVLPISGIKLMQGQWWHKFSSRFRSTAFDPALIFNQTHLDAGSEFLNADLRKFLNITISRQSLDFVVDGSVAQTYSISTSKYGVGCRRNTGCTPLGWHVVSEKIGAGASIGTTFKGRRATGIAENLCSDIAEDLITSRILWLSGLQYRFNQGGQVDSKDRYIYIHGTAQEQLLGKPVSEGCIRISNTDVLELFEMVASGTPVFIG